MIELRGSNVWEVVPFTGLVMIEGITIALTITANTVMTKGMNPFVFVFYSNALSSLILLPHAFVCLRDRSEQPPFTFSFLMRLFFLGLTGITIAQNLAFTGLSYSSPIVVIAMVCCIPAISFVLAIILRTTKLSWRRSSCKTKIFGTLISFMGAIMITLYKGPVERKTSSLSSSSYNSNNTTTTPPQLYFIFTSSTENWILGSILLAASSFFVSIWNIIQLGAVKQYPEVMTIVSFYSLFGTIQCAVVTLIAERNLSAYKLGLNMELLIIVLTAVFGSAIRSRVHMWCMRMNGPFYVPMFKPFGIVFATIFGTCFFSTSFHYGSVIAAFITGIGYYMLMWGELKENNKLHEDHGDSTTADDDDKVPLLQEDSQV